MKVVFVSCYFNHHQKPLSDALFHLTDGSFRFVAVGDMPEERRRLGYTMPQAEYLIKCAEDEKPPADVLTMINNADIVISGSAPYDYISTRIRKGALTFLYAERIYKSSPCFLKLCWHFLRFQRQFNIHRNTRLLCASAFTAVDFARIGCFKNRAYKWGYFPAVENQQPHTYGGHKLKIMWAARFLDWKHPEMVVKLGEYLSQCNIDFTIDFYGNGKIESDIRNMVDESSMNGLINFHGSKDNQEILHEMSCHDIFLQTSDHREGWGATINEAMACGCAVVASDAIGAAPYLIKDGVNGLLFHSCNQKSLNETVKRLALNDEMIERLGHNAALTMENKWSPQIAAERFIELSKSILAGSDTPFSEGPCSKA